MTPNTDSIFVYHCDVLGSIAEFFESVGDENYTASGRVMSIESLE